MIDNCTRSSGFPFVSERKRARQRKGANHRQGVKKAASGAATGQRIKDPRDFHSHAQKCAVSGRRDSADEEPVDQEEPEVNAGRYVTGRVGMSTLYGE